MYVIILTNSTSVNTEMCCPKASVDVNISYY